jgi:hypothetical protein
MRGQYLKVDVYAGPEGAPKERCRSFTGARLCHDTVVCLGGVPQSCFRHYPARLILSATYSGTLKAVNGQTWIEIKHGDTYHITFTNMSQNRTLYYKAYADGEA